MSWSKMNMKHPFIYILTLLLLVSCVNIAEVSSQLLPEPQSIIYLHKKHQLTDGGVKEGMLKINLIETIEGADMNQDEAYRLRVLPNSIVIDAVTEKGVYWAQQTLNQLVMASKGRHIQCVDITDYPAFRIRGFMHDTGRSYMSVDEIKKHIRLLSKYKINVFHWHLTENQGWRLESKRHPILNDSSSYERHHGQYYTIEEAKEIADYCKAHNMLLIPEIDMPGHSAAFVRATGADMQSKEGITILKDLIDEICTEVFPDLPYLHIGTDEVHFVNPDFVPEMVEFVRSKGKKAISWNPGWNYKPGEIDMTQLWSYRGKEQPGIPAVDSRFHYINHFDAFADIIALYNSRILNSSQGSDDIAGGIIAIWNDRLLPNDEQIVLQNNFYPSMLAFAERSWCGGGSEYFDQNGTMLPTDENDSVFKEFSNFESRMLWHKDNVFSDEPFAYVKQTDIKWRITDAFPNSGNLSMSFPPETELSESYQYNNEIYNTHEAIGAGIYLRHVWGQTVPSFYENPKENHTAYAYTWVWSPNTQEVGLWASTQDYSRSEPDLAPPHEQWDYRESKMFINDREISPPIWENTHTEKSNEITLKNENFQARLPIPVQLNKGWNKVLLKLPIGSFSTPWVRLQKWSFTFVFVTPDGKNRPEGLIYNPDRKK